MDTSSHGEAAVRQSEEIQLLRARLERENFALKDADAKLRPDEEELRLMTDAKPQMIVVPGPVGRADLRAPFAPPGLTLVIILIGAKVVLKLGFAIS